MNRLEFMKELESLLFDIPLEEREEALQYYNGYFEDAGEDHEEEIIKELGSPSKVASIIKADLNSNAEDREKRGYFTEHGYQDTFYKEEKFELVGAVKNESSNGQDAANTNTNASYYSSNAKNSNNYKNQTSDTFQTNGAYQNSGTYQTNGTYQSSGNKQTNGSYNSNSNTQSNYQRGPQKNNSSNTVLLLLIGIFAFPIWFPLLMGAFGVAIGIISAILGIIFGFGVAGIVMMGVGVVLFITGLVQMSAPFVGLLMIGSGLFVLGLGMLFALASFMLCTKVLPAIFKGIVELCRLPFKNRSVMA